MKFKCIMCLLAIALTLTGCQSHTFDKSTEEKIVANISNLSVNVWGEYCFTTQFNTPTLKENTIAVTTIADDDFQSLNDEDNSNDYKLLIVSNEKIEEFLKCDDELETFMAVIDDGYSVFFMLNNLDYADAEDLANELSTCILGYEGDHTIDPENCKNILVAMHVSKRDGQLVSGRIEIVGGSKDQTTQDYCILRRAMRKDQ